MEGRAPRRLAREYNPTTAARGRAAIHTSAAVDRVARPASAAEMLRRRDAEAGAQREHAQPDAGEAQRYDLLAVVEARPESSHRYGLPAYVEEPPRATGSLTRTTQSSTENATSNAPRRVRERRNFCTFDPVGVAALVTSEEDRVRRRGAPGVQTGHVDVAHRAGAQAGADSGSSFVFSSE